MDHHWIQNGGKEEGTCNTVSILYHHVIITLIIKLLRKNPFQEYETMSLTNVTKRLMKSMSADLDPSTVDIYRRNVALLVSY